MKKKIAAFANGWSDEFLLTALKGIKRCAEEYDYDIYFFVEYTSYGRLDDNMQGEFNILNLADLSDYEGVLLMGNTLTNAGELDILRERILKKGIPAVCLEYQVEGIDCICTENYSGMYELAKHLIEDHGAKRIAYVSGIRDNAENMERKRALEDALKEHGLSLSEDDVVYGEWSYYTIQQRIPEWMKDHALPDVFVCANDVMALGAITALANMGYTMPDDVLVTGFDNINSTKIFMPSLTTIDRGWTEVGYEGMKHLLDLIDGGEKRGTTFRPSRMIPRESCGCEVSEETRKIQMASVNKVYNVPIERTLFDWHLTGLDDSMTGRLTMEDIHDGLQKFFKESPTNYEGDTFCICLDDSFVQSIFHDTEPRCLGYGEQMHVLYAERGGKSMPYQKIKTSYIFPVFSDPSEKGNIYYIAPMHSQSANLGYVVFKNRPEVLETFFLYSWIRHLHTGLMRCRENIIMENMNKRLHEMSIVDELSGLYNRKGYVTKGIPLLEEIKEKGSKALMMVVDINKMKMINDRYGHLQGDLAIRLVAKAIRESLPENWYGIRYGGDEFVIIGENVFVDDGSILKRQIISTVEAEAKALMIPFPLSVSVGSVLMDPKANVGLDEYFQIADAAMYDMKKKVHEEKKE
ncbi:MAG: GGDEF domain-containing protein [Clostridiales bacterium]|nr:GGDEF domain-containing protein [Clostridiales bacterium]